MPRLRLTTLAGTARRSVRTPRRDFHAAFTMIELLVVIAIIAILAGLFHWRFRPWIATTSP